MHMHSSYLNNLANLKVEGTTAYHHYLMILRVVAVWRHLATNLQVLSQTGLSEYLRDRDTRCYSRLTNAISEAYSCRGIDDNGKSLSSRAAKELCYRVQRNRWTL